MDIKKLIKEIGDDEDLLDTLRILIQKKSGVVYEYDTQPKLIGTGARLPIPKKYMGYDVKVLVYKSSKIIADEFKKELKELEPSVIPVPMTDKELELEKRIAELELNQKKEGNS